MILEWKDKPIGTSIEGVTLCKRASLSKTKTGKWKLDFLFGNKENEIEGVEWNKTEGSVTPNHMSLLYVKGVVGSYNDKPQLVVNSFEMLAEPNKYGVTVLDLLHKAPIDIDTYVDFLQTKVSEIKDEVLRNITLYCLSKVGDEIKSAPAAKAMHHAYWGGLLFHEVSMLQAGLFMCKIHKTLWQDLVVAGIVCHDLGKTAEMAHSLGVVSDYTTEGKMRGHIVIISHWVKEACDHFKYDHNSETVMLLDNLLLSHHGKLEWGSPVMPATAEAVLVHQLDMVNAKTQAAEDAIAKVSPGSWTEKLWSLDGAQLYRRS